MKNFCFYGLLSVFLIVLSPITGVYTGVALAQEEDPLLDDAEDGEAQNDSSNDSDDVVELDEEDGETKEDQTQLADEGIEEVDEEASAASAADTESGKGQSSVNIEADKSFFPDLYIGKGIEIQASYTGFMTNGETHGARTGADADVAFSTSGAGGIGLRYDLIRSDGFGMILGTRFEFNQKFSEIEVAQNGVDITGVSDSADLHFFVPEFNLTHEFEGAYFLAGVNYLFPVGTVDGRTAVTGGLGGQVGIGWALGNHLSNLNFGKNQLLLEIVAHVYSLQFTSINGTTTTSKPITLGGGIVRLGYNFR